MGLCDDAGCYCDDNKPEPEPYKSPLRQRMERVEKSLEEGIAEEMADFAFGKRFDEEESGDRNTA